MTPEETIRRAEHAKQLMEDETLLAALAMIEAEIISEWEQCPARDVEGREFLWKYYKTSKKFRGILLGAIESGKIAAHGLREKASFIEKTLNSVRAMK